MEDNSKKKKDPTVLVRTEKGYSEFPEKPGVFDYVKEAFEPTNTRAQLDAIRARKAKYGS